MAASDQHSPVTLATFDRYENGEMSHEEQYALEKRMLEDPLVAEAYEGYLSMKAANVDPLKVGGELSDTLNARLSGKRKVIPMWYYAAAASVIMVLGASWLVFFNARETLPGFRSEIPAMTIEVDPQESVSQKAPPPTSEKILPIPAPAPEKKPARPQQLAETEAAGQTDFNETNIDIKNRELIVAAEAAPAPAISAPAAPSASATVLADKAESANPGLAKSGREGAKMAARSALANLDSAAAPSVGWEAYQAYLQKNTELKIGHAEIIVRFTVNADGTLSDVKATGNQPALSERAVRIVKDGPAWRPASLQGSRRPSPQEVTLHFHSPE
ncbi:energy transducer TonB [Dyadobacter luticola]|uniref:TonB C-terminal domain-containing protein n=1 Tax=Dyadobacter luticola TaxID=1979387 RepID=A0A5R9L2R2_9BACT|nr:hypothetical protein [Dyadobacter luticola]TLV02585.1 hypothetical protein FEN17_02895 [Dyadobacter luticola]